MSTENTPSGVKASRPLSPHLQVYKPQITSTLSILHRLTGVALSLGTILLIYWLSAAAYGPGAFERAQELMGSWFGRLVLFGMTFALFFHLCSGIRHLFWDIGIGFELPVVRTTGVIVVVAAIALTVLTWIAAYAGIGRL